MLVQRLSYLFHHKNTIENMLSTRRVIVFSVAILVAALSTPGVCGQTREAVRVEERGVHPAAPQYHHEQQRRKLTWDFFGFLMMSKFSRHLDAVVWGRIAVQFPLAL